MQANINFDFSELESQFKKISDGSRRSLSEQNRLNSIMYLREMMYATRKRTGSLRAGFLPAWFALGQGGTAGTNLRPGDVFEKTYKRKADQKKARTYYIDGGVIDNNKAFKPSFTILNKTYVVAEDGKWAGKKYEYVARIMNSARAKIKLGKGLDRKIERLTKIKLAKDLREIQRRLK